MAWATTTREECEITIRLDKVTDKAHICCCWPDRYGRLERRYGKPESVTTRDGKLTSAKWTVPIKSISFRKPLKTCVITTGTTSDTPDGAN